MRKYEYILFDFDGTIIDTGKGIINSIKYTLEQLDYDINLQNDYSKFIGPPLNSSFREFCNFDDYTIDKAIKIYRDHYDKVGMYQIKQYEDIDYTLKEIKKSGMKIILATSKYQKIAEEILINQNLISYFDFISGSTLDSTRNTKIQVIDYAIKENKIENLTKVIMIGDRKYDILGANQFNIDSIGVLYGYGTKDELINAGAKYIVNTPKDILNIIC